MAHCKPVNRTLAQGCMDRYVKIYGSTTDPKLAKSYSTTVTFDRTDLVAWLNSVNTDSVNISFGVYTEEYVKAYPNAVAGRLSAFFAPILTPVPEPAPGVSVVQSISPSIALDDPGDDFYYNLGTLAP